MNITPENLIEPEAHIPTILLIENNPADIDLLSGCLQQIDSNTLVAPDGESALEMAPRFQPDQILLDVSLPGIDGIETCRRLKAIESLQDIPVIFLTDLSDIAEPLEAFRAGEVDWISRPLRCEEILARVKMHLSLHSMHKQLSAQNAQLRQDFAERSQAERALRENEELYRTLFEQANDAIFIENEDDEILDVNSRACKLLGYSREELLTMKVPDIQAPEVRGQVRSVIKEELKQYSGTVFEGLDLRRDGTPVPVEISTSRIGTSGLALSIVRDITERKQAEAALRESEERYRSLVENLNEVVFATDTQGSITYISPVSERVSAYTAEEITGQSFSRFIHPNDLPELQASFMRTLAGRLEPSEFRIITKHGAVRWVQTSSRPQFHNGQLVGLMGILTDITERRWADQVQEAVQKISQAATSVDNLEDLYRSIHSILGGLMPVDNLFIALYDAPSDMLSYPYYVDQYDQTPAPEEPGRGLTAYVLRTGRVLLAPPEVFNELVEQGEVELIGSPSIDWLGVPLRVDDRIIGVMAAQSYTENVRYGKQEMNIMEFVSTQVAMAIERRQAEEALSRKIEELTVLHAVAIAGSEAIAEDTLIERATQIIGETLYTDNFGVLVLDDEAGVLRTHGSYRGLQQAPRQLTITLGEGIVGQVAVEGRSRRISDVSREPTYLNIDPRVQSELCVPLKAGERVIGVINAESAHKDAYTETDERLLETVASQLATTIEKLRLFEETRRHLQRLNALHKIDRAITASMDLKLTLDVLLSQALSQLGIDAGDILLFNLSAQTLEYAAGRGFRTTSLQHPDQRLNKGYAGRIVLGRAPVYIPNLIEAEDEFVASLQPAQEGFVAYFGVPIIAKGEVKGVLEVFHRAPLRPKREWFDFLAALAAQAAIAIDNTSLFDALQRSNQELTMAYDSTLEGWSRAMELRDQETEGHTRRVTALTMRLAKLLGVSDTDLVHVRRGAILHDIGKIGIPDKVLQKPGSLSTEERKIMQKHPGYAFDLLRPIAYLRPALDIPLQHHEKWDGSGYPRGLKGEQIALAARAFAVADVWDALNCDRPYRKAWQRERALEYMRSQAGSHFEPRIVGLFLDLIEEK